MDDNSGQKTTESCGRKIDVNEIMTKIRENIRMRSCAAGEIAYLSPLTAHPFDVSRDPGDEMIRRDLAYMHANYDIHNNSYFISSHRPYLGKILVRGRSIVHGEVRRFLDPVISRQTGFNAATARILSELADSKERLEERISDLEDGLPDKFLSQEVELTRKMSVQKDELTHAFQNYVDLKFNESVVHFEKDLFSHLDHVNFLEEPPDVGITGNGIRSPVRSPANSRYFLFQEQFRGSREDITGRQKTFLPYFARSSNVLDIGCGRGEFLEILRDNNIAGFGVDLNPDMTSHCRARQLEVVQNDAIRYLKGVEDGSLEGIFIDQVVEHMEPAYLVTLLALCYRKMKAGYYIVIETVNPLSFVSLANFYQDLTHRRPIHPDTLMFLVNSVGFRETEKKFFSPIPEDERLRKMIDDPGMGDLTRKNIGVYNDNIDILNRVLFGAQDYAVIGKK